MTFFFLNPCHILHGLHIFSQVVKVYYVNQLSAGRVVRAMRCCHEMRVRVNVAIVFRCARVYSYWQIDLSTFCKIAYVLRLFPAIKMYTNDAEPIIRFLMYLISDNVLWRITDHCAAILDESTLSPTDTRTFSNSKKIEITIFHIFTLHYEFHYDNWATLDTII